MMWGGKLLAIDRPMADAVGLKCSPRELALILIWECFLIGGD